MKMICLLVRWNFSSLSNRYALLPSLFLKEHIDTNQKSVLKQKVTYFRMEIMLFLEEVIRKKNLFLKQLHIKAKINPFLNKNSLSSPNIR